MPLTLEESVAKLEEEVRHLKAPELASEDKRPWWEKRFE